MRLYLVYQTLKIIFSVVTNEEPKHTSEENNGDITSREDNIIKHRQQVASYEDTLARGASGDDDNCCAGEPQPNPHRQRQQLRRQSSNPKPVFKIEALIRVAFGRLSKFSVSVEGVVQIQEEMSI